MESYDEDLSENPLFSELKSKFSDLYQHCATQSWIICVPRIDSLNKFKFTVDDYGAHILLPSDELPETYYSTLSGNQATVVNKVINIHSLDLSEPQLRSHILFEEIFYTHDNLRFKVWCIEEPLEPSLKQPLVYIYEKLNSLRDSENLLWTLTGSNLLLDQIKNCVETTFTIEKVKTLTALKDTVKNLYTKCVQISLQNRLLKDKSKNCKQLCLNINIAVETYVQHLTYDKLFKAICTFSSYRDSRLNKTIRNLCDLQLIDLDIKRELYQSIPKARQNLSSISNFHTILEKVACIKKTIDTLKCNNYNKTISTDDIIPIFVYIVIKSSIPNWNAQLEFMKQFSLEEGDKNHLKNETAYLLATFESALEYIYSGHIGGSPSPESLYDEINTKYERNNSIDSETESNHDNMAKEATLNYLFTLVKNDNYLELKNVLERNKKMLSETKTFNPLDQDLDYLLSDDDEETETYLCHPLCNCLKCYKAVAKAIFETAATVNSRDSHGFTALHIASMYGKTNIIELLINMGADIDSKDIHEFTPLHHAALRGQQAAVLLLIHSGANINAQNIDKNTPLHLAANNGHLNCVKPIIYYAQHTSKRLFINCHNEDGDTPLHLASKWGYEGLTMILIDYGADPSLQNLKNKSVFDYGHNLRILKILNTCSPNLSDYIHINETDIENNKKTKNKIIDKQTQKDSDSYNSISEKQSKVTKFDKIVKFISYGDIKLACFYMNIMYPDTLINSDCHPLCECSKCQIYQNICPHELFDINKKDSKGDTLLHHATEHESTEFIRILINNGAYLNSINNKGQTVLHTAVYKNNHTLVNIILESGINVNISDEDKQTPLHIAIPLNDSKLVCLLLHYNPKLNIYNKYNKTPLDIASEKGFIQIVNILENYLQKK